MPESFLVEFQPIGRKGRSHPGHTLLDAARAAGLGLASVCGGAGTCEECRLRLVSGPLTPPTLVEQAALGAGLLSAGWRLACQAVPLGDVRVHIPPESLTAAQRLQVEGLETRVSPEPAVRVPGAHGLAVDIGTTKLAAYLIHLASGTTLAQAGAMNPQVDYGEDVISRIAFADREASGAVTLRSVLVESMNGLLQQLCAEAHVPPEHVLEAVLVGNTAMHHVAAGLPLAGLGQAPFSPFTTEPLTLPADQMGLLLGPGASVYFPPVIAGWVGSDHLAMLLASGLLPGFDPSSIPTGKVLALDIGTNTEIALCSNGRITSCSCASGPAFEGAHIHEGMRAAPGAIERCLWKEGAFLWQTIDGLPPVGICGSGILDVVASLLAAGLLKPNGALVQGSEVPLVPASQTGLGRPLVVTRKDVHEIQLAKAAIRAGIETLLANAGLQAADLDLFIVAGAFGTYLDLRSAVQVGMFPSLPLEKFSQLGNLAGVGSRQMLVSLPMRHQAETQARRLTYLELARHPLFQQHFIRFLSFHPA